VAVANRNVLTTNEDQFSPGLPDGLFFRTKNPNAGKFWRALELKMLVYFRGNLEYFTVILVYFMAIWYILWPFGNVVVI
jgi:hypothetical protein